MPLQIRGSDVIIGNNNCSGSNLHYTNIFLDLLENGSLATQLSMLAAFRNKAHDRHIGPQILSCLREFRASAHPVALQADLDATIAVYEGYWPAETPARDIAA